MRPTPCADWPIPPWWEELRLPFVFLAALPLYALHLVRGKMPPTEPQKGGE